MAALNLNFLGELEVVRDDQALPLPPSKKTRALLAYLALNPRRFRREALCDLLWEMPDDPRGSLRWSLSKLRRLVDDPRRRRIIADRNGVSFDATDVDIDVTRLRATAADAADGLPVEVLERAASAYRGSFLSGLESAGLHEFHAWCVGERERAAGDQACLLRALLQRLAAAPERAVRHARALVVLCPYDESARASLIRLLLELRHDAEAEHHLELGRRMLQEVGATSNGALLAAWRGPRRPPAHLREESAAVPARAATLVGREREIARLAAALERLEGGGPAAALLLRGEPGMGKTRLLEAAAEMTRSGGARVLRAAAFESEMVRPFALWIDALRRWDEPEPAPAVFQADNRDNRDHLFNALGEAVGTLAAERPLVLLFDDLHWCDESSAAALHYVLRTNPQRPVFALLAVRDGELEHNTPARKVLRGLAREGLLDEISLDPLPRAAARELIEWCAPQADSERLSAQCAGNPLLAIELARAESTGAGGTSLDQLIDDRLSRLGADGSEVLRWASVLDPHIDLPTLVRVSGMTADQIGQVLELAERQAMLLPAERGFRFSHDLIRRGVYDAIAPARRRLMHRRLAELLERDAAMDLERAADLAHHATHSGEADLACRALVSAGRLCLRFFANADAAALARRGLELTATLPAAERVCLGLDLHDILLSATPLTDWQSAARTYVELAEQALDHGALAHARLGYQMAAWVRWANGQWSSAREETLQAERVTRGGTDREHIIGMAETAKCLAMLERDLPQADALLMEAQTLAGREGVIHHSLVIAKGLLRFHGDHLEEAEELFQEARALSKSAGDRVSEFQANENLALIAFQRDDYPAARERCMVLAELGERLRDGSEAPFARALSGLCRYAVEDDAADLDAALDDLRAADAKVRLACVLTRAALLDTARQRPQRALTRAEEALQAATALDRATEIALAHGALRDAHRHLGHAAEHARHDKAIAALQSAPVAAWARQRLSDTGPRPPSQ